MGLYASLRVRRYTAKGHEMKGNELLILLALLGVACLSMAYANETSHTLDEIVVTASGQPQPVEDIIPAVIVIDRETIARSQSAGIADLLRWHAGMEISRTGGPGQQTSVFIRGTNSNHTAVLINGVKMNSATTGGAALAMLDTSLIERIEIIKGPRSTVYGSEAIGGVINVITSVRQPRNQAELRWSDGRYSTDERGASFSYANDYLSGKLAFNRFDTDGFPARTTSVTDHGHNNETVSIDVGTRSGRGELAFNYWQATGNTEYSAAGRDVDQDHKNEVLQVTYGLVLLDNWRSSLSFSRTRDEIRQNQKNFLGDKDFIFTDRSVYDWKNTLSIGAHTVAFGLSGTDEDTDALSYGTDYRKDTDIRSVYLRDQWTGGRHGLFASARYTDHENFDEAFTWNVEYGYQPAKDIRLFAGSGSGFRAPDGNARFGFGGNPDLREETSRSVEVGVSHDLSTDTILSLRAFENKVEDLIAYTGTFPSGRNRNIDEVRIRGIELSLQHRYGRWDTRLEGIMQNPRNESDDTALLRRAKRTVTGALTYRQPPFSITTQGLLTSQRKDFGDVTLPGYGLFNLSAGVDFRYATLLLKVDNLFDKDYELASGYSVPGRAVFAELRLKFARQDN